MNNASSKADQQAVNKKFGIIMKAELRGQDVMQNSWKSSLIKGSIEVLYWVIVIWGITDVTAHVVEFVAH